LQKCKNVRILTKFDDGGEGVGAGIPTVAETV
jgi:hypothetical protein